MVALGVSTAAVAASEEGAAYPDVPEPMVFDLVRGLGARQGELEVNTLLTSPLSGQDKVAEWAPEIEYAVIDNLAVEFELPFENMTLTELKVGVQATFGTMDNGRIAHGLQYLGIYHREDKAMSHAVLYLFGRQHSDRLSTMTMVGVGDVRVGQSESEAGLLLNHTTFYRVNDGQIAGLELNYKSGPDGGILVMPQYHMDIIGSFGIQIGAGLDKQRGQAARPVGGLRAIVEF